MFNQEVTQLQNETDAPLLMQTAMLTFSDEDNKSELSEEERIKRCQDLAKCLGRSDDKSHGN
jgi:hypothetical protein